VSGTPFFTPGDLVISVYGDGDGSGTYTDNQAGPIVLEELTQTGSLVTQITLPQSTTIVNGTTEYVISGEYGSSSEGSLELSGDGQSLVIAGYGVNAAAFNAGGVATYGTVALAQSTSIPGGTITAVPRVIADINAYGTVDTSTAVYNIDNGNNPRSVATLNGSQFYISGQGMSGDTTQGVFLVNDGTTTTTPTAIDNSTDTRTLEIYHGALYVSRDSKQPSGTGTSNIANYGTSLPAGATAPVPLPGISQSITLTAAEENSVNSSRVGKKVSLSPENFFFADPTTLYVADGGNPKQGGLGDGGLQKWSLVGNTWTLDYTLSAGLNLVANTGSAGTTGLIGLTGTVVGSQVILYATNATLGDLDPTYLYGIVDSLGATTPAPGESFTQLVAAAPDTNIRGVSFAPTVACFAAGTRLRTPGGDVPVERLSVGGTLLTVSGQARTIGWIGRCTIDCARHASPEQVTPIRVAADAFGPGRPSAPLYLSPDHGVFVDDVLIPVKHLVNGDSIRPAPCAVVTYFHVALATHDVVFAHGLPCETYLDGAARDVMAVGDGIRLRAAEPNALNGQLRWEGAGYAPLVVTGAVLDRVRARIG
jgi:hypothetical protein